MSDRTVRHFVEGLLRGQRTQPARPDDFEAAQMAAAIRMRATRIGSDAPSEHFVTDLHRRLAEQMDDEPLPSSAARRIPVGTRRQVVVGTGVAAASAAAGIVVGRNLLATKPPRGHAGSLAQGTLAPNAGAWRAVGAGADLPTGGALAFDLGSVTGFVHRSETQLQAVSGVCTHQGCKLWLDAPESRLRCPCHTTIVLTRRSDVDPPAAHRSAAAAEDGGA